jgi:chromosome segregation protein
MQGFKSFPDKISLTFGRGITAVVGPNGSGKSNISDAVRWVLGEQSVKSLRGGKMEDMVFNGTATRRPVGFAEVTLNIENRDRRLPFDTDEVAVTRRYYRSGDSDYMLNRASARLKDIHELFMDTGLGRDGYSIIGQGKIDEIVNAKSSAQRREIFEEAAGISRFRYRREEAERRLAQAEDNLSRLKDIQGELETRVAPLKEQSDKAEQFLKYAGEKRELEISLALDTLSRAREALREQDYKIALADKQFHEAEEELDEIGGKIDRLAQENHRALEEAEEIRHISAAQGEESSRLKSEAAVLENTVFHNGEAAVRLENDMADRLAAHTDIDGEIGRRKAQMAENTARIAFETAALAQTESELAAQSVDSATHSDKLLEINKRLNEISAKIADFRVRQSTAESALAEMDSRGETLEEHLVEKNAELTARQTELSELTADLAAVEEAGQSAANALKGYELRLESRRERAEKLKAQAEQLFLNAGEAERRVRILEDLEKNLDGFQHSVQTVLRESARGTLPGIHGPVSRLVSAKEKYQNAVEVALGAALQNIVTETEADAKRAIELLKRTDGGRATFLPLNSVSGRRLEEPGLNRCPGFLGLAAELVTVAPQYAKIIDSLLGRVAVAETLDGAFAIARRFGYKFRVVTLDGQVVNAGGSLTGGSMAKNAGMLNRQTKIETLKAQHKELLQKTQESREAHRKATEELAQVQADVTAAASEVQTAAEDKIRVLGEMKRVNEAAAALAHDIEGLKREGKSADLRRRELTEIAAFAAHGVETAQNERQQAQAELAVGAGERERLARRREELSEKIAQIRMQIHSIEKDIGADQVAVAELLDRKQSGEERVDAIRAEKGALLHKNTELEEEIARIQASAAQLEKEAVKAEEKLAVVAQKRLQIEKESVELRELEKEKVAARERFSGELARLNDRKTAMLREHDDVLTQLFDEYGLTRREAEETGFMVEDPAKANRRLKELKNKIRDLGTVNVAAIEEYKEVYGRYTFLCGQIDDVEKSRSELRRLIEDLTGKMKEVFLEKFMLINKYFQKTFVDLFGGGAAELRLTQPEDALNSGVDIFVEPPGKRISVIEQMSGGEKALISLSVYFAIMRVNPPPFCVLDEVESALDDVNVTRFADYLRHMSENTQYIVVTHRRGTMEEADVLYGVTMQEKGVSKLLALTHEQLTSDN